MQLLLLGISEEFTFENFKILACYLQKLSTKIESLEVHCITLEKDYTIEEYDVSSFQKEEFSTLNTSLQVNFFLDYYYYEKEQLEEFTQYRNSLLNFIAKKLKKISKKLDNVNLKIQECSKIEEYKLYGELLTSNLYKMTSSHIDHIILGNYYNQNEPVNIPLDISLSPADNAKKYFKKYHKLKNTIDIVTTQKAELEGEIDYLESIVYELQASKSLQNLDSIYNEMENANLFSRKTKNMKGSKAFYINKTSSISKRSSNKSQAKTVNDFSSYNIDGFTVLVGKNNQENDYLTMKLAKENDLWFHVKDIQGSHVILVVNQKEPSQETINKVAAISAYYSKAKQSSNVPVDYTLVKYVKKPAKAKPGMVIYTNQKTVNVNPK